MLRAGRKAGNDHLGLGNPGHYQHLPAGSPQYKFIVAFPAADVPAMTALFRRAYASGEDLGLSVAGRLWQAPQPEGRITVLRAAEVNLLSKAQAHRLYRLLVPPG